MMSQTRCHGYNVMDRMSWTGCHRQDVMDRVSQDVRVPQRGDSLPHMSIKKLTTRYDVNVT